MSTRNINRPIPRDRRAAVRSAVAAEPLERRQLLSTVVVNTTADSTDAAGSKTVSLRDAIAVANASTTPTTISFNPTVFATSQTIVLNEVANSWLALTNISEPTTIVGPAVGVAVSGNHAGRVFVVGASQSQVGKVTATIQNLTFANGTANGVLQKGSVSGAGFDNVSGISTLVDVTVSGSSASGTGANIGSGGGIINHQGSTLFLTNVTVSGNSTTGHGGGIVNQGVATLDDVTVANNTAGSVGGGIYSDGGTITISNSIVANDTVTAGSTISDVAGAFSSKGHNLIGTTDGSTGWTTADYTGTVAKPLAADLGPLANNGGPTQTLLPLAGSPAIDKGSNALIPVGVTTDQRGLPRVVDGTVDIGAVEVQPSITLVAPANQSATEGTSTSVTLGSFTQFAATSPFKDTISWGDGSANTVLTLTAAGTIPATAHAFAKAGTLTVTEMITDAKGNTSNVVTFTETVVAPPATISGTVFDDANGDGKQEKGEIGLGLWTVYLDLNDDGKLDAGDTSVTTDINGAFTFTGLAAGTYYLRIVPVTGDVTTAPSGGLLKIVLTAGELLTGNLFGEN